MRLKHLTSAYFVLLTLNILAGLFDFGNYEQLTKPLLMPMLMLLVWKEDISARLKWSLIILLAFSLLGDVLLQYNQFVGGLAAFLLAQLSYIFLFFSKSKGHFTTSKFLRILPFLFFIGLMCFGVLNGKLPEEMAVPVYAYMLVIMCMGIFAAVRKTNLKSFEWVLVGAILFMVSDSFIAINKFFTAVPYSIFWVMSTYGLAQYLLIKGLIFQENSDTK